MIYSNFYKKWIATCMRCKLALINFETSANKKDVDKQNFYDYQILKKYFITDYYFITHLQGKKRLWKMY